jgi:hypothetical protein
MIAGLGAFRVGGTSTLPDPRNHVSDDGGCNYGYNNKNGTDPGARLIVIVGL